MVKVAPSILDVNIDSLEKEIKDVIEKGADYIHIDVMDGKFVSKVTNGVAMYEAARKQNAKVIDVHLMVDDPNEWLDRFPHASIITFQIESFNDKDSIEHFIDEVHSRNIKVGITLKPGTGVEQIMQYVDKVDMVLIMTVEPGLGGQKLIEDCLNKVRLIRMFRPDLDIEVDGGINLENIDRVKEAGANVIVAGTAIFKAEDRRKVIEYIKK